MNALPLVSVIVQFATNPVTIYSHVLTHLSHTVTCGPRHTLSPVVHVKKMCIMIASTCTAYNMSDK